VEGRTVYRIYMPRLVKRKKEFVFESKSRLKNTRGPKEKEKKEAKGKEKKTS